MTTKNDRKPQVGDLVTSAAPNQSHRLGLVRERKLGAYRLEVVGVYWFSYKKDFELPTRNGHYSYHTDSALRVISEGR